jgi:hypothetical protein
MATQDTAFGFNELRLAWTFSWVQVTSNTTEPFVRITCPPKGGLFPNVAIPVPTRNDETHRPETSPAEGRILHSIPLWHFTCSPFGDCRSRRKRDVARQTQGFQRCEAFQDFFSRV